jgi:hypothetical protein
MDLLIDCTWIAKHVQIREQMPHSHLVHVLSHFIDFVFIGCHQKNSGIFQVRSCLTHANGLRNTDSISIGDYMQQLPIQNKRIDAISKTSIGSKQFDWVECKHVRHRPKSQRQNREISQ